MATTRSTWQGRARTPAEPAETTGNTRQRRGVALARIAPAATGRAQAPLHAPLRGAGPGVWLKARLLCQRWSRARPCCAVAHGDKKVCTRCSGQERRLCLRKRRVMMHKVHVETAKRKLLRRPASQCQGRLSRSADSVSLTRAKQPQHGGFLMKYMNRALACRRSSVDAASAFSTASCAIHHAN